MSKIGRKPINIAGISVTIEGNKINYKGPKGSGMYELPAALKAEKKADMLIIAPVDTMAAQNDRSIKKVWGLHRALLANKISGVRNLFTEEIVIVGLGFKATLAGKNLVLSLGYSHKIDFPISAGVTVTIDKTGQKLLFESADKVVLGGDVSRLKEQRPPEPYKGTGIRGATENIYRKDSKKKA